MNIDGIKKVQSFGVFFFFCFSREKLPFGDIMAVEAMKGFEDKLLELERKTIMVCYDGSPIAVKALGMVGFSCVPLTARLCLIWPHQLGRIDCWCVSLGLGRQHKNGRMTLRQESNHKRSSYALHFPLVNFTVGFRNWGLHLWLCSPRSYLPWPRTCGWRLGCG